jgi:dissimilatory sulfite reductase (desulfoviridin) alpha/beta subunit
LKKAGLTLGACGPRVRVIVTCQAIICSQGIKDARALAQRLDKEYYGEWGLPHKFKMGVSGCPNACSKPQENDLGFVGVALPIPTERCTGCGLCKEICSGGAILDVKEKPAINYELCVKDLKCLLTCPEEAFSIKSSGWDIYIGGKFGKRPVLGRLFGELLTDDEAVDVAGKVIGLFKQIAKKRERLSEVIERVGYAPFLELIPDEKRVCVQ